MSDPNAPEPTFTQSPNILNDCIQRFIDPHEYCILDVIVRKTYGFHKREDPISNSQIEFFTGFTRPTVTKFTRKLEQRKLIVIVRRPGRPPVYTFGPRFQRISDAYMKRLVARKKPVHRNGVSTPPGNGVSTTPQQGFPPPRNGVATQNKVNKSKKKTLAPDGVRTLTEYHDDELNKAVDYIREHTRKELKVDKHLRIWWYQAIKLDGLVPLKYMIAGFCDNKANRELGQWDWITFFKVQAKRANYLPTESKEKKEFIKPEDDAGISAADLAAHREATGG